MNINDKYLYFVKCAYELCSDKNDLGSILRTFDSLLIFHIFDVDYVKKFICYRLIYTCFCCDDFLKQYECEIRRVNFWAIP